MNPCARGGYLVDATSTLPADPTDVFVERLPIVGCSRIQCERCGAAVRHATGLAFRNREHASTNELSALYDLTELATSPLLAPTHPDYRLYFCRCNRWLESSAHACREPELDPLTDPQMPWGCAGHPIIAWPHDVNGVMVRSLDDLREIAIRGFAGGTPLDTRRKDAERGYWLARLRARVDAEAQVVLDSVAAAMLEDHDAHTRALAVMYVYNAGSAACVQRVLQLLAGDRRLYTGIPDDVTPYKSDETLEESMWRALRPYVAEDADVRDAMRVEALSGRAGRSVFAALAREDADWFLDNSSDLARAAGSLGLLEKSFAQLPPGSPVDALRKRVRTVVNTPANKEAVARRTVSLADRIRARAPDYGATPTIYEPLPGIGDRVQLQFVAISDTERAVQLLVRGEMKRELKRGTTIEAIVFLESDVTPDRIRDALKEIV